jgi:hypothetical protein
MVDEIMDATESESLNRHALQRAVREAFNAICGDYPGAVTVRHSYKRFETFALIDREEEVQAHDGPNHMGSKITHTDIQTGDDAGSEVKRIPETGHAIGGMRESVEGVIEGSSQTNNNKMSSEEPVATRGEKTSTSTSANTAALTSMAVSKYLSPSAVFRKLHSGFDRLRKAVSSTVSAHSEVLILILILIFFFYLFILCGVFLLFFSFLYFFFLFVFEPELLGQITLSVFGWGLSGWDKPPTRRRELERWRMDERTDERVDERIIQKVAGDKFLAYQAPLHAQPTKEKHETIGLWY